MIWGSGSTTRPLTLRETGFKCEESKALTYFRTHSTTFIFVLKEHVRKIKITLSSTRPLARYSNWSLTELTAPYREAGHLEKANLLEGVLTYQLQWIGIQCCDRGKGLRFVFWLKKRQKLWKLRLNNRREGIQMIKKKDTCGSETSASLCLYVCMGIYICVCVFIYVET